MEGRLRRAGRRGPSGRLFFPETLFYRSSVAVCVVPFLGATGAGGGGDDVAPVSVSGLASGAGVPAPQSASLPAQDATTGAGGLGRARVHRARPSLSRLAPHARRQGERTTGAGPTFGVQPGPATQTQQVLL